MSNFNSSVVRLRDLHTTDTSRKVNNFNSSVVRLRDFGLLTSIHFEHNFNSSVVRLRVFDEISKRSKAFSFQFQCGAIEGTAKAIAGYVPQLFQFQCGAIEGTQRCKRKRRSSNISIPVWCDWGWPIMLNLYFFTCISIPVWCDWGGAYRHGNRRCYSISIPVWCDWGTVRLAGVQGIFMHFNSSVVRLREVKEVHWVGEVTQFQFQCGAIEGNKEQ